MPASGGSIASRLGGNKAGGVSTFGTSNTADNLSAHDGIMARPTLRPKVDGRFGTGGGVATPSFNNKGVGGTTGLNGHTNPNDPAASAIR